MIDAVERYARDITAGRIVAGKPVRLACERHLISPRRKSPFAMAMASMFFPIEMCSSISPMRSCALACSRSSNALCSVAGTSFCLCHAEESAPIGRSSPSPRHQPGMTQQDLADRCGLDLSYVGGIERGQRNPTLGVIHALASVLGVRMADLLEGE